MKTYINQYHVSQCYGGPEEGGWYYHHEDPLSSLDTDGWLEGDRLIRLTQLQDKDDALNKTLPDFYSVLSEGEYVTRLEDKPAERYPESRPYYE